MFPLSKTLFRRSFALILVGGFICQLIPLSTSLIATSNQPLVFLRCVLALIASIGIVLKLPQTSEPAPTPYSWLFVVGITGVFPLLFVPIPMALASIVLGLFAIAALNCVQRSFGQFNPVLLGLLISLSYPLEWGYSSLLDPYLQFSTTFYAAPLVTWTGFPVEIADIDGPLLYGNKLAVYVTPLCAGLQTFINLFTLGIILSLFFLKGGFEQLVFCLLTPVIGFIMNTLRIVISTHAANRLVGNGGDWELAHDVIGYASFLVTYALLFLIAKKLQPKTLTNPKN